MSIVHRNCPSKPEFNVYWTKRPWDEQSVKRTVLGTNSSGTNYPGTERPHTHAYTYTLTFEYWLSQKDCRWVSVYISLRVIECWFFYANGLVSYPFLFLRLCLFQSFHHHYDLMSAAISSKWNQINQFLDQILDQKTQFHTVFSFWQSAHFYFQTKIQNTHKLDQV